MLASFPVGRQKISKMIKVAEIVGKLKIFFLCSLKDLLRAMASSVSNVSIVDSILLECTFISSVNSQQ